MRSRCAWNPRPRPIEFPRIPAALPTPAGGGIRAPGSRFSPRLRRVVPRGKRGLSGHSRRCFCDDRWPGPDRSRFPGPTRAPAGEQSPGLRPAPRLSAAILLRGFPCASTRERGPAPAYTALVKASEAWSPRRSHGLEPPRGKVRECRGRERSCARRFAPIRRPRRIDSGSCRRVSGERSRTSSCRPGT